MEMKKFNYYVLVSIILIAISCIMFSIHYLVFGQAVNTAYYSLMNLCFIPINSLVVTIILERIIDHKAKEERMNKLNMLVGIFFTEVGCKLMHLIINADKKAKNSIACFDSLDKIEYDLLKHEYEIDMKQLDLQSLKTILIDNSNLIINLISNENLLQHEIFTDLIMSVVHLRDELVFMKDNETSDIDINHLKNDIMRVYKNITIQWVHYLEYLNKFYPFLYNNAIRVNPFKFK